ncbi:MULTISPECIES: hypothetical protein [Streptomyces]|uniref:Uncharacterized protein n=1 Tax=Streptomyces viridochromogenes TaxID=1938 RepID=A0A0L8LAJ7_STRVR|nr:MULTISPECIES: hypothetical protein [Streptomyces]KOG35135.1 hypothetical protein ADK34_05730 [Streptomyces viridochromogenes]
MPVRRAVRDRRAGGAPGHLLLVVVLALGVFLMHAVGHPEGSGGGTDSASRDSYGAASHVHAQKAAASHGAASDAVGTGGAHGSAGSGGLHGSADRDGADSRHDSGAGMDMTTLCVAVLGAWLLAGLVRAALGRRPDWLTLLLARLTSVRVPHAPPRRPPDLARLSVLRI